MISKRGSKLKSLKSMVEKFNLSSSDVILDAGCGYGLRSFEIGREVGCHVVSVDLSLSCLKSLQSKRGNYDIDIVRADLQNLPLKNMSFDKVICGDVLEHVPNVFETLEGFYEITKKKGILFLLVPSSVSEELFIRLDNTYAGRIGHLRTFQSEQLLNLVKFSGFYVLRSYHVEFFRALYHLLQVLSRSRIEHQTGRVIEVNSGLSAAFRISRMIFYSRIGDLIETAGKFIFPNSFVIIAAKI